MAFLMPINLINLMTKVDSHCTTFTAQPGVQKIYETRDNNGN